MILKRNLLAHEMGHNLQANNESGNMTSVVGTQEIFTPFSVDQFKDASTEQHATILAFNL